MTRKRQVRKHLKAALSVQEFKQLPEVLQCLICEYVCPSVLNEMDKWVIRVIDVVKQLITEQHYFGTNAEVAFMLWCVWKHTWGSGTPVSLQRWADVNRLIVYHNDIPKEKLVSGLEQFSTQIPLLCTKLKLNWILVADSVWSREEFSYDECYLWNIILNNTCYMAREDQYGWKRIMSGHYLLEKKIYMKKKLFLEKI
jgi:hypothetical protein